MVNEITRDTPHAERQIIKRRIAEEAEAEGRNRGFERREAIIRGAIAQAFLNPKAMVLMDPEDPKVDVNDLYQRRGRQMLDPRLMNFGCPLCKREMAYELFVQHAEPCMEKWYKTLDPTKRRYTGGNVVDEKVDEKVDEIVYPKKSVAIKGAVASADSKGIPSPGAAEVKES